MRPVSGAGDSASRRAGARSAGLAGGGAIGAAFSAEDDAFGGSVAEFDLQAEAGRLMLAVRILAGVDVAQIQRVLRMTDTLGPVLDPTGYRDALQRGDLAQLRRVCDLARPLIDYFEEVQHERECEQRGDG